jgi:small subunit ribosomal protein S7
MSRKHSNFEREILPDPRFGSEMIARFINMVMMDGKKSVAERIVYGAIEEMESKGQGEPLAAVEKALENVAPAVEVKSRRVGGATYQVPVEVRPKRQQALAMRWVIDAARKRGETTMPRRLAGELLEAMDERGSAVKKREETHRMAEANKAFAHYRW